MYTKPELEVINFVAEDVITTSTGGDTSSQGGSEILPPDWVE